MRRPVLRLVLVIAGIASPAHAREPSGLDVRYADRGVLIASGADAVALTPSGGVISVSERFVAAQCDADGRRVQAFGIAGATEPLGSYDEATAVTSAPDGAVLATAISGKDSWAIARLLASGAPDTAFGVGGVAPLPSAIGHPIALVATSDGGALVAGLRGVARIAANGALDRSYAEDGVAGIDGTAEGSQLVDAGAGRVVLLASSPIEVQITRLLADGRRDPSFGIDGSRRFAAGSSRLAITRDRQLVVASASPCASLLIPGVPRCGLVLRHFADDGHLTDRRIVDATESANPAAVTADPNGRLLIEAGVDDYAGPRPLLRVDRRGRRDFGFGRCGTGAVRLGRQLRTGALSVQPSGRILWASKQSIVDRTSFRYVGWVIAALRGGKSRPRSRPTRYPTVHAGTLHDGVLVSYTSAVDGEVTARITDRSGRTVGRVRRRARPCRSLSFRVLFARRPRGGVVHVRLVARGGGEPRVTRRTGNIDERGRIAFVDSHGG